LPTAITHLLSETSSTFQNEIRTKQAVIDNLHASLRITSTHLGDCRRTLETLQATVKKQQLARQQVANLSHARDDEQVRLVQEQGRAGRPETMSLAWETELSAVLEAANGTGEAGLLPSTKILRARMNALTNRREMTRKMVHALKGRSRDVEVKYRRVVSLCTGVGEEEVDAVVDGLVRAVESEKGELEIGRVRRFLGGVEGTVH
jgi:regulatory protein SWI6